MRRRRSQQLQVSLFPFLAVLLCMLGALILLLLVLDQRSRQQVAEEAALRSRAVEDHSTEIQERLQALLHRRQQLKQQLEELQSKESTETGRLQQRQAELAALQALLRADEQRANELEQTVTKRQTQAALSANQRTSAEAELARLQERIRVMEQAVQKLREAAGQKQQPVYSLVPYKGRQGTGRRPLYLECRNGEVIFRPDGTVLTSQDILEGTKLRQEIEQRAVQSSANEPPYVLLLIRPSGIGFYYGILGALQGVAVDVGYEFIEEDWALDFSEGSSGAAAENPISRPETGSGAMSAIIAQAPLGAGAGGVNTSGAGEGAGGSGKPAGSAGQGAVLARPEPVRLSGEGAGTSQTASKEQPAASPAQPSGVRSPAGGLSRPETKPGGGEPASAGAKPTQGSTGSGSEGKPKEAKPPKGVGGAARDWVIVIECSARAIVVHPTKFQVNPTALGPSPADNPLLWAVQEMIAHRRGKNRDLEPQLKWAIREDGLRTYYQAARALETLKLPATWEIVPNGQALEGVAP